MQNGWRIYEKKYTQDIYFRVSSSQFNWFNIIWKIVYDNKSSINKVTIKIDKQSGKKKQLNYYILSGEEVNRLDTNTFLTLKGNPVVESKNIKIQKLRAGLPLLEALGDYDALYNNIEVEVYRENYIQEFLALID